MNSNFSFSLGVAGWIAYKKHSAEVGLIILMILSAVLYDFILEVYWQIIPAAKLVTLHHCSVTKS